MLSDGQIEVQKIINSYLKEYENLQQQENTTSNDYYHLYKKVRNEFGSNYIIKSDSVTSQPLGISGYSKNYLEWLVKKGVEETIEFTFKVDFPIMDFPMRTILYNRPNHNKLEEAYLGGAKWNSTISCLFGLAQGKRLNSDGWDSRYYDAIQLWEVVGGGNHRLLSHILFGSPKINPNRLRLIRNDFVDHQLNKSLLFIDDLFNKVNDSNCVNRIEFNFDVESLSEESTSKIKNFFCDIKADEKVDLVRCINALKKFPHEYISNDWGIKKIEIDNMYRLLSDIRRLRSKPSWYRQLLILKQKFFGIKTVDSITCTVLRLATWDTPYWKNGDTNDQGWLRYLPGLRELLLPLFK